jgi:hypothetical protein
VLERSFFLRYLSDNEETAARKSWGRTIPLWRETAITPSLSVRGDIVYSVADLTAIVRQET